jgi:hypothetical protein
MLFFQYWVFHKQQSLKALCYYSTFSLKKKVKTNEEKGSTKARKQGVN